MNSKSVAALVVGVVVVVGAGVLIFKPGATTAPTASPSPTVSSASPSSSPAASAASAATITYDAGGFKPATTTVKSGDAVTFTNSSSSAIQVDSDPHPVHTDDTDLNVGTIAPGASQVITVTKKGSFGIHNHLDPSMKAAITIQ